MQNKSTDLERISLQKRTAGLLRLLRLKQWIKNGFVLAPLLFSGEFLRIQSILDALIAMVFFCLASSASYIVNDIRDVDHDRKHPLKALSRPLANGTLTITWAMGLLITMYGILALAGFVMPRILPVIISYILLNFAYSAVLKHQPVVDIFTIAAGFVLRVYAGALAISVPVSGWMFITTLCLALYLASVKRRQELILSGSEGRTVLKQYSVFLVNRYAEMSATGALVFYSLYVMTVKPELIISIPLVLFGLFRYWFVVEVLEGGESPTDALIKDLPLLASILAWLIACAWALWPIGE